MNKDREKRTRLLLSEANHLHDRLLRQISAFQSKVTSLVAIAIAYIGIHVTIVAVLSSIEVSLTAWQVSLLGTSSILALASGGLGLGLLWPTDYRDKEILLPDRIADVKRYDKEDLYSQLLGEAVEFYNHNWDRYKRRLNRFPLVYGSLVGSVAAFLLFGLTFLV